MPDFVNDNVSGMTFEASVRHVARQLYRHARTSGSVILHDRERDEIIDTGTELIVVEATQSRKLDKVEFDLKKSSSLIKELKQTPRYSDYNFRIMLVTAEDPTADQNAYVKGAKTGCPKEIVSFTALFSRLFDGRHYIRIRGDHSFGSIRDPANEANYKVPPSDYIATSLSNASTGETLKAQELAEHVLKGGRYVLFGDYGSGKSMTLRDVYFRIRDRFTVGETLRCPVYLNLREHIAQTQPDEALFRHAEKIGFGDPHSLIAAWRAGFVTLFLDGFDELTPPQFASSVSNLQQARRFAVELVLRFIEQTPQDAPVIIAGRESYFDTRPEAKIALGYNDHANVFDLGGFTDKDIQKYLKTKNTNLPTWLPTRPLLLGYLANSGLLKKGDQLFALNPANGWDQILDRVCQREVRQIWGVGFEPSDLRYFLEGLATHARKSRDGRGLEDSDLRNVFRSVFGRDTDEPANLLALRLPGLGAIPGRPGAREFIDADFADAAASGDVSRFIEAPFTASTILDNVVIPLGELGRQMSAMKTSDVTSLVSLALSQSGLSPDLSITSNDLITMLVDHQSNFKAERLCLQDANFATVIVDPSLDFSNLSFARCIIETIEVDRSAANSDRANNVMQFHDCMINSLEGALSLQDVPTGMLCGTSSVEKFTAFTATNVAVMKSDLPDPVKVLLTILRKLFMQRGTGRQYSALRRGLPHGLVRYVEPAISLVKSNGFAEDVYLDRRVVLVPNRSRANDALAIINGPNTSNSPLIGSVRQLQN